MKSYFKRFGLMILTLSLLLFSACEEDTASEKEEKVEVTSVEVETIQARPFTDYVSVVGTIKPYNNASISHETGGILEKIVKEKGEYVSKGDTILILNNDALKAAMESAKAQYELADARFERQRKVYEDNVGSEFEFLNTKYTRNQLKAAYDQAKVMYEKSFIKAPFNGIVDSRAYDEGEFVPPAVPVVRVLDASRLKIEAGIPERYAGDMKKGAEAKIFIKELFNEPIISNVSYVGKALDPSNRTFPIEVIIANKNNVIKPGMMAEVYVERRSYDEVIIIPEEVVSKTDDGYIAFVAENGIAKIRNLNIVSRVGEDVVVDKGLSRGEKLVVLGFQNLVDGENIKIVN